MSGRAKILGAGLVDLDGIAGTVGVDVAWSLLEHEPPGTGRTMRAVFGKPDATFRRLDPPSRALVLACEAAGVAELLTADERQDAGLFIDSCTGSLASDLRFAASLDDEMVAAGVFPFTLPSTTLGEVALRYGLRGPTISWSAAGLREGEGVREALRQFATGEIRHAIVGAVDVLPESCADREPTLRAVVAVIAPAEHGELTPDLDDPLATILGACRAEAPSRARGHLLACGLVDEVGIAGTRGVHAAWASLGQPAPGTGRTVRELFGRSDATFRRLDAPGRALVLACEAAGVEQVLTDSQRQEAAILVETDVGALAADLQFTASLDEEALAVSVFPFVLTTTCLGEVALRYGVRGPTNSLSIRGDAPDHGGESVREALRLFESGEAEHAIVGVVETLLEPACGREPVLRAVVAVLGKDTRGSLGPVAWPIGGADPFAAFAARCR